MRTTGGGPSADPEKVTAVRVWIPIPALCDPRLTDRQRVLFGVLARRGLPETSEERRALSARLGTPWNVLLVDLRALLHLGYDPLDAAALESAP